MLSGDAPGNTPLNNALRHSHLPHASLCGYSEASAGAIGPAEGRGGGSKRLGRVDAYKKDIKDVITMGLSFPRECTHFGA